MNPNNLNEFWKGYWSGVKFGCALVVVVAAMIIISEAVS